MSTEKLRPLSPHQKEFELRQELGDQFTDQILLPAYENYRQLDLSPRFEVLIEPLFRHFKQQKDDQDVLERSDVASEYKRLKLAEKLDDFHQRRLAGHLWLWYQSYTMAETGSDPTEVITCAERLQDLNRQIIKLKRLEKDKAKLLQSMEYNKKQGQKTLQFQQENLQEEMDQKDLNQSQLVELLLT